MRRPWLRVSVVVSAIALVFLAGGAPANAGRCLPPTAGEVVGRMLDAGRVTVPPGWQVRSVNIDGNHLVMTLRRPGGSELVGTLVDAPHRPPFFRLEHDAAGPATDQAALQMAEDAVNRAFAADPFRDCSAPVAGPARAPRDAEQLDASRRVRTANPPRGARGAEQLGRLVLPGLALLLLALGAATLGRGAVRRTRAWLLASSASTPRTLHRRWHLALMVGLVILAAMVRVPELGHAYFSNELALIKDTSFHAQVLDSESATNPPLHRLIVNLPGDAEASLRLGRGLSLVAGLLAVLLAFIAGRRAGRSWAAGTIAGLLVALHPFAIETATTSRAYGIWTALALWHFVSLARFLEEKPPLRSWLSAQVAASALLMPQFHYFSLPLLLVQTLALMLVAPEPRKLLEVYAPAVIASLPLVVLALTVGGRHHGTSPASAVTLSMLTAKVLPAYFVGFVITLALFSWRRLAIAGRLAFCSVLAVLVVTPWVGALHVVRPQASVFAFVYVALLIGAAPAAIVGWLPTRRRVTAIVLTVLLGLAILAVVRATLRGPGDLAGAGEFDAVRDFTREALANPPRELPWAIYPAYDVAVLQFYATGTTSRKSTGTRCGGDYLCLDHQGQIFVGVRSLSAEATGSAWVVAFEHRAPDGLKDCRLIAGRPWRWEYDCSHREAKDTRSGD